MAKKIPGPDEMSAAYECMLPKWDKIRTLMEGTDAMRCAGRAYLPQHDQESDTAYNERLAKNTLLNMLSLTVDAWVGKPFSEPVKVGDDVPDNLRALLDNIDLQGNNVDVYMRNWFKDGLAKGFSHTLIDFPRIKPREDGQPRTLADDRQENVRPYFVHIKPENLYFGHCQIVNGVETVDHIRIKEQVTEIVGWEEVTVPQLRVITPGLVQIFRQVPDKRTKKPVWREVDSWPYQLDFVPIVTFYADRQSYMESKPPLNDLADLNVEHWQSKSDQLAILTVARFPILGVSGAISDDDLKVGPHQWLHCPDPAGRFYYVEHAGKAIGAGRTHLIDLEETMAEYGATFLKKRPGGASATARALDTAEVTSPLEDMAIRFQGAMQHAFRIMGMWLNMKPDEVGTFTINTAFDFTNGSDQVGISLQAARVNGDLSRPRFLKELHRLGVVGDDFDPEENDKELTKEQATNDARDLEKLKQTTAVQAANRPAPAAPGGGAAK